MATKNLQVIKYTKKKKKIQTSLKVDIKSKEKKAEEEGRKKRPSKINPKQLTKWQ